MARAARLAVEDRRGLQQWAENTGSSTGPGNEEKHLPGTGRAARCAEHGPLVESVLGSRRTTAGLDLLELTGYAWHDCYKEITLPGKVIREILICSRGDLATMMVRPAKLAIEDWRDLQLWAEDVLAKRNQP